MRNQKLSRAFTLIEIMLVVVVLGVIVGFAIPNYTRTMERTYASDAIMQLSAMHSANQIIWARTGQYWPTTPTNAISAINTALNLNIIPSTIVNYNCAGDGTTFSCTATRNTGTFTVTVTQMPLGLTNPLCTSGSNYCPG